VEKPTFEEKLPVIDDLLRRKRHKWTLTCVPSMDFDDVCQIIRIHIHKKWDLWDHTKPLENWASTVITHQINNLLRNNYLYVAPPCSKCSFNQGGGLCGYTKSGLQNSQCKLYSKWEKVKKVGFNMKLAESMNNPDSEASFKAVEERYMDWDSEVGKFHKEMKHRLPPDLFEAYDLLFIQNLPETEVAKTLGFKTTESNRPPGYKQMYNIKKEIIEIAKEVASDFKHENY
jgi:DNA-directed RNA polymerase specialized sigma24 family protein